MSLGSVADYFLWFCHYFVGSCLVIHLYVVKSLTNGLSNNTEEAWVSKITPPSLQFLKQM